MSRKYKFHNKQGLYFVSFATVNWIEVFTRQIYFNVLVNSVNYCRAEMGMELYCYCFMPSHVHFIFRSTNEQPMELLRDFKKYTSKKVIEAVEKNGYCDYLSEQEKSKVMLLNINFGNIIINHIELWSEKVIKQKIDYIHTNPLESGFVINTVDWKYSSARNFQGDATVLEIDSIGFFD